MNYHVYHFTGVLQESFSTAAGAQAWIDRQLEPTRYYFEYQESR